MPTPAVLRVLLEDDEVELIGREMGLPRGVTPSQEQIENWLFRFINTYLESKLGPVIVHSTELHESPYHGHSGWKNRERTVQAGRSESSEVPNPSSAGQKASDTRRSRRTRKHAPSL